MHFNFHLFCLLQILRPIKSWGSCDAFAFMDNSLEREELGGNIKSKRFVVRGGAEIFHCNFYNCVLIMSYILVLLDVYSCKIKSNSFVSAYSQISLFCLLCVWTWKQLNVTTSLLNVTVVYFFTFKWELHFSLRSHMLWACSLHDNETP